MTTFHSLTVAKVEPETRDAVTITFAVPQALQEAYRFRPGQHLTLKTTLGGDELRRCYSICRSTAPGEISVAVKAIEGGRFSRYARDEIKAGMALEVMVPQGQFGYQPRAEREGHYLAIAAGSGITPMLAIISATLATEPNSHFTLIYGNRSSQSMMFRQALADLKDKYPQRLQLLSIFSQERLDSDLLYGRIDGEKLQALAKTSPHQASWLAGGAAALLSNVANNLPVGLAAGSLGQMADLPAQTRAALLVGVDLGPNLSVTGSLATMLWLMALRREGEHVSALDFLRVGALVMPPALIAALLLL